ncbi:MAG: sugar transferase [Thermotogae bacterium]|nr:MAG: sugar transferase [Thermotogota bacterium]
MKFQRMLKRSIDIVFAVLLIALLSPFMVVIALLIKLEDHGPVLFKQERLGKDGKVFVLYKFRTMIVNAEKVGLGIFLEERDPRITRIGKWLRELSLDELPQLFNILRGDMSFVGPRPPLPFFPKRYDEYEEWAKKRFTVRPGITGWAQVNGRNLIDWYDRFKLDVWYVDHWSLWLDTKIVFLTILKILKREGIYGKNVMRR